MNKGFDFGQAIHALKAGARVCREGWAAHGMWVAYSTGSRIPAAYAKAGHAAAHLAKERLDDVIDLSGHLDLKAADGSLVVGWLPSLVDLMATDWCILD